MDGQASIVGAPGSYLHPSILNSVQTPPKLHNKNTGGWTPFVKEWRSYIQSLQALNSNLPLPNHILINLFKSCLDSTDTLLVQRELESNPNTQFRDLWDLFSQTYEQDSQAQLKLAWESVKLPPGDLTLEKWMKFLREFELKRNRVEDRTPQEEQKLLLKQLPDNWQKKILKQEANRSKGKFLTRISNLPRSLDNSQLAQMLSRVTHVENFSLQLTPPRCPNYYSQSPGPCKNYGFGHMDFGRLHCKVLQG
jgi:hypothetical protein